MSSLPELMQDRQFWLEFINEYKALPVLWKQNSLQFSSRKCRDVAYLSLTKKVRSRWSEANVEFIKQRISNFRRTFLNEYEKVKQARKSKNAYVPSLYYYNHLKFLKEDELDESDSSENGDHATFAQLQATQKPAADAQIPLTFPNEFIKIKEMRLRPLEEAVVKTEIIYEQTKPPKRLKLIPITKKDAVASIVFEEKNYDSSINVEEESIESEQKTENDFTIVEESELSPAPVICEHKQNEIDFRVAEDEFDDIARRVATHFRKMDPEQCLFAEKLIFDVCISGRLKRLTALTNISDSQ